MNALTQFRRCLAAEVLKLQNTLALAVAFGVPFFLNLLVFIIFLSEGNKFIKAGTDPWIPYTKPIYSFWSGLVMILLIILQAALINSIEHKSNAWPKLYSMPVPRGMVYFSKLTAFLALNLLSALALFVFEGLFGLLLGLVMPFLGFQNFRFSYDLLALSFKIMLAGCFIMGFQFYLSYRSRSFVLPLAIGFCLMVTAGIINSWQYVYLVPYALPSLAYKAFTTGHDLSVFSYEVATSFGLLIIVSLAGFYEVRSRS